MTKENPLLGEKHYTATVFLITEEQPLRVLLVHHKKINKWLPPGGHQEEVENSYQAAIRETREETGIEITNCLPQSQSLDERVVSLPVPRFILEEKIDAHGDQPEHFHLDMIYVVSVPHQQITRQEEESNEVGWFTREEIDSLETFENVSVLAKTLLGNFTVS